MYKPMEYNYNYFCMYMPIVYGVTKGILFICRPVCLEAKIRNFLSVRSVAYGGKLQELKYR
jgi:hypothetical protein